MRTHYSQYSFSNFIYMLFCLIRTRLFYPGARIIRFPFDIRNRKNILIGEGFTTGRCCRLEVCGKHPVTEKCLTIGTQVQINDFVHIAACQKVSIGDHVLIASKVFITDINHGNFGDNKVYDLSIPPVEQELSSSAVCIEDRVWIGESVCILPGVTIGKYSVIGALATVTKSIPPYSIAVGNPARVIKRYNQNTSCWEKIDN